MRLLISFLLFQFSRFVFLPIVRPTSIVLIISRSPSKHTEGDKGMLLLYLMVQERTSGQTQANSKHSER